MIIFVITVFNLTQIHFMAKTCYLEIQNFIFLLLLVRLERSESRKSSFNLIAKMLDPPSLEINLANQHICQATHNNAQTRRSKQSNDPKPHQRIKPKVHATKEIKRNP